MEKKTKKNPHFDLILSHRDFTHHYWKLHVNPSDHIIDATCGNGKDTYLLASLIDPSKGGRVTAIDIQKEAIAKTQEMLAEKNDRVTLHLMSHVTFPMTIQKHSVSLIVYNLGYLPGGDHKITTQTETTLQSLSAAQELLVTGGLMSITCYPGHSEGMNESREITRWASNLNSIKWNVSLHKRINKKNAPFVIFIQTRVV